MNDDAYIKPAEREAGSLPYDWQGALAELARTRRSHAVADAVMNDLYRIVVKAREYAQSDLDCLQGTETDYEAYEMVKACDAAIARVDALNKDTEHG